MREKYIIFDFDGTMVDSMEIFIRIFNKLSTMFNYHKIKKEDKPILKNMKTLKQLKQKKISLFKVPVIAASLKKIMNRSMDKLKFIDSIPETIKTLNDKGYKLSIISSNSQKNIRKFLKKNLSEDYFEEILECSVFSKYRTIKKFLKHNNLSNKKDEIFYIGDEYRDIKACKKAGITIIAVDWGFNSKEILSSQNPYALVSSPEEILTILGEDSI